MIKKSTELHLSSMCMFLYGISGIGKTSRAKTLPGRKIIVSLENGCLSVAGEESIDIYDCCVDGNGKELVRSRRIEKFIYFMKEVLPKHPEYDWIIVDSLTELSQILVEHLKTKYPDRKDSFPMWGEYSDSLLAICKSLRDCKRNIYITALDATDKDETGRRFTGIDVAGKISSRIPALFDEVFYMKEFSEEGKLVRKIITGSFGDIVAKDRSGKLSLFEDANLGAIINKIKGTV